MRAFALAAELGSFAAAADALGVSGPMVGKHVRQLEHSLGARLIHRTTRRQSLTEIGALYYDRCKIILAEAAAADALVADTTVLRGKLRIGMPVHLGRHCVAPVLTDLARQHVQLELELSMSDDLLDLADNRLDLVVRTGRLADRADHIARLLGRQRMVVCGSPDYLAQRGAPLTVDELPAHDTLPYGRNGRAAPWSFPDGIGGDRQVMVRPRLLFDDLDAIADAAEGGLGLAWLPLWLVKERLEAGRLLQVLRQEGEYLYDCHAVWLASPFMSAKMRVAIDALGAGLANRIS